MLLLQKLLMLEELFIGRCITVLRITEIVSFVESTSDHRACVFFHGLLDETRFGASLSEQREKSDHRDDPDRRQCSYDCS